MEDLEILCTDCHKKHHNRRVFLTPKALYAKLTKKQKGDLCAELGCKVETLYLLLLKRDKSVTATVKNLLGIRSGKKNRKKIERRRKRRV
jgi:hypothetical protein